MPMPRLFDCYSIEEAEGLPMQYVGVHVVKWHDHPPTPTVAFVESRYTVKIIEELIAAGETAMECLIDMFPGAEIRFKDRDIVAELQTAIAKVKGDVDG